MHIMELGRIMTNLPSQMWPNPFEILAVKFAYVMMSDFNVQQTCL